MENSQLKRMEDLLRNAKLLPDLIEPEKSIFSIGGRGHWENPTTEILAFFCDNNATHGLGNLVLKSLIQCLNSEYPEYHNLDFSLSKTPEREVRTSTGKRIDLLLESEDWVLVLENKIFHIQDNPFQEYEDFVDLDDIRFRNNKDQAIFIVLSPQGDVTGASDRWSGVSYESLIKAIKLNLADYFKNNPLNKWVMLLREFVLHLEGLLLNQLSKVEDENISFVLENISAIKDLQNLKMLAINQWHEALREQLGNRMGKIISIKLHNWDGFPAMRFACEDWTNNDNDVVLFFSGKKNEAYIRYFALLDSTDKDTLRKADGALMDDDDKLIVQPFMEGKYRVYDYSLGSIGNIVESLYKKIKLLDAFYHQNSEATKRA